MMNAEAPSAIRTTFSAHHSARGGLSRVVRICEATNETVGQLSEAARCLYPFCCRKGVPPVPVCDDTRYRKGKVHGRIIPFVHSRGEQFVFPWMARKQGTISKLWYVAILLFVIGLETNSGSDSVRGTYRG